MLSKTGSSLSSYRGRFAPSPTGLLHFGSLAAAAASYLRARQAGGEWLLRIEDIDPPREIEGASDAFLTTLDQFGFEWDGEVTYQSQRHQRYRDVLDTLREQDLVYRCRCSRRDIKNAIAARNGIEGVYPGTCDGNEPAQDEETSWRFRAQQSRVLFTDLLQGEQSVQFGTDQGDFIVWRKDDLPSYQLAVTVDDMDQSITEVVRGIDLLHETAGQILIRRALSRTTPDWVHIPVVVNHNGYKLSKQTGAAAVDPDLAAQQLCVALGAIGLEVDDALKRAAVRDIWSYALESWQPNKLFKKKKITLD